MTNNELLAAMSDMMDIKLRSGLQPLKNEMQDIRGDMQNMRSELQGDMQNMRSELQGDMQDMKSELQGDMQNVKSELQGVIQNLEQEVHQLKLCQENLILPRLNTIESCYTDTYHRYRDNADRMEDVFNDVDIMKKVITEHSQKIQKLA